MRRNHAELLGVPEMEEKQKNKRYVLRKLFFASLYLSTFTFGGGYVIVTLLKEKFVDQYHWIDEEEMLFHTLHGRAALGAEERVEVVVAALNGTLEDGADIRADTAGHVVGRNVSRLAARRAQAAREAARQVEQNLGDVIAVVPEGDFPVIDRLRDEFVLRILQEIFEENQMFQVFHIVPSFKIIPIAAM